jgi:hypothetical protein
MTSSALLNVKGLLNVAGLLRIAGPLRVAGLLRIAELLSVAGQAMSRLLVVFRLIATSLLLANSEGVKLDRLTAFSKFNPNLLVLPNPISYSLSELLSSLQRSLDLWEAFLRVYFNLSNFLLNWADNCLLDWVS